MHIYNNKTDLNLYLSSISTEKSTIGFVPTMGALHFGHLSLLKKSVQNNTITVISIFVNPTQFNNADDLEKYPRTLDSDVEKIQSVNENIIIYTPSVTDIYDANVKSESFSFDGLEHQMEGKFRPGHFNGVGTVVKRLFEIINPTNAYFGEKDFQQLQIVNKLVENYKIPVKIIGCEIFREDNGLAMSSRNERLSQENRQEAAIIYKTLIEAKANFKIKSITQVLKNVIQTFKKHPKFELEYFTIADEATLETCQRKSKNKKYRGFIAVIIDSVRLIDTISF